MDQNIPASTCFSAAIISASLSLPRACSSLPPKYEIILRCVRIWGSRSEAILTPADGTFAQDPSRVPRLQYHRQGFDAIVSFDAYHYFGTDDLYLGYISKFLKPGGYLGIVIPGVREELTVFPPPHLAKYWVWDFCVMSASSFIQDIVVRLAWH